MISSNLFDLPVYFILVITFSLIIFFCWLGYRFKISQLKKYPGEVIKERKIQGTALTLLSLLMGFTFSVAISKFETQRRLIAQEAAYINTAILRCDMYPDSIRNPLRADFKEYIEARIEYYDEINKDKIEQELLKKAGTISDRMWKRVILQFQQSENILRSGQMIPALNNMIEIVIMRDAEKSSKVPFLVLWVLLTLMLIEAFVIGTDLYGRNRAKLVVITYAIVMSITLNLIIELHQPRTGLINLDSVEQKIVDLRELVK